MIYNAVLVSLFWFGKVDKAVGDISSISSLNHDRFSGRNNSQPKYGSLNSLLGEIHISSNYGHRGGGGSKHGSVPLPVNRMEEEEEEYKQDTVKGLNKMNRGEQEMNCILLEAVGHRIPNSNEICTCSHETGLDLTCAVVDACSESTNNLCADATSVHMDLNSGVSVEYCSQFPLEFTDTCVTIELNNAGDRIETCEATYGGENCDCNVCDDQSGISIDCSLHNCRATTNGCQNVDLSAQELVTIVPDFQPNNWVCPTPAPNAITPAPATQDPTPLPLTSILSEIEPEPLPLTSVLSEIELEEGSITDSTDCTPRPPRQHNEPRPPPEGPKDCFLFSMLMTEMPDAADWCICDGETSINCYMDNVCSDGVCADQLDLVVSLENGNNAETCTKFSDDRFEETCVSVEANLDGTLVGCNYATYDGQQCGCEICDDNLSLSVDCSMYNEYATVTCQGMEGVEPQVLAFKAPPIDYCDDTNDANDIGASTGDDAGIDSDRLDVREPFPPPGADQSCQIMALGSAQLPPGAPPLTDFCYCDSETSLSCRFYDACNDDGLCANQVDTGLDIGSGAPKATYCVDFEEEFEETCVGLEVDFSQNIQACEYATYGGQPCECSVCDDQSSVIIDCSAYNPLATTITCQGTPTEIGPVIPAFQSSGGDEESILDECGMGDFLEGRYRNAEDKCTCNGDQRVDCTEENYCFNSPITESSTCAESVEISVDVRRGTSVTNCVEFDEELNGYDFDATCVEVALSDDFKLEECQRVTYGGQECTCQVCGDGNSIEIDCREYDENAWIPCQRLEVEERLAPFVPNFGGSLDGSNERIQRYGCSGGTTITTAAISAITILGTLISYYHNFI